jgi:hypothetical protein
MGQRFVEHPWLGLAPTRDEIEASRGVSLTLVRPDPANLRTRWVAGCDRVPTFSRPIDAPPRPPCPIFG